MGKFMEREYKDLENKESLRVWWTRQQNRTNYRKWLFRYRSVLDFEPVVLDWLLANVEGLEVETIVDEDCAAHKR